MRIKDGGVEEWVMVTSNVQKIGLFCEWLQKTWRSRFCAAGDGFFKVCRGDFYTKRGGGEMIAMEIGKVLQ